MVTGPDSGEEEVQSRRVHLDEEGTWKGDEMGHGGKGRQQCVTGLLLCCCAPLMSSLSLSLFMYFICQEITPQHPTSSLISSLLCGVVTSVFLGGLVP